MGYTPRYPKGITQRLAKQCSYNHPHAKARTAPDLLYRKAVSEIWSRFKNKFRVPRYADLPAINSPTPFSDVNALELRCAKWLEDDSNPLLPPIPARQNGRTLPDLPRR